MRREFRILLVITSAVVCLVLFFRCSQTRKQKRILGAIEIETATGKESKLLAPAVAQVGKDFKVTIYTYGGGCESIGDEEVTVSENTATVKVYDFTSAPSACTLQLKLFPHTVTLRFAKPGEAIIKIVGQREVNKSIWRRRSFVREHRLMVTTDEIKPELDPDLPDQWTVTETRIGPIRIGMNSQESLYASGGGFIGEDILQSEASCWQGRPMRGPSGILVMWNSGSIARVDVDDGFVATAAGARIGDSEIRIRELYPQMKEMGFSVAFYPTAGLLAASQALASVYASHAQDRPVEAPLYAFNDFLEMIGFRQVWDFEKKYAHLLSERPYL